MNHKLTGRTKYRLHKPLFGDPLLVLMVEEHRSDGPPTFDGLPEYLEGCVWRDATVGDLAFYSAVCAVDSNIAKAEGQA